MFAMYTYIIMYTVYIYIPSYSMICLFFLVALLPCQHLTQSPASASAKKSKVQPRGVIKRGNRTPPYKQGEHMEKHMGN